MRLISPFSGSDQVEWDDLRGKLTADSALGLALCGWLAGWYLLNRPGDSLALVLLAMGLMGAGAWLWQRSAHSPQQSAIIITTLTFGAVCVAWYSLQTPALVYVFALPMMLAALLLRTWTTFLVGAGVWLVVYGPLAPGMAVDASASALLVLLCAFQATVMRSVRKHLTKTQHYQAHAVNLVEQARVHQEEVKRLNKSLGLAYSLLRRRTQELATARQEAENALRMKEQFAIYVSHELRTPLNIMLGFLEILQRYPEVYGDVQWTPTLRRDIAEIQRSARHLLDLVNDLLDLARIDAVKMPIHREQCRLEDVLSEAIELMRRLLVQKPVQLRLTVEGTLPTLYIDRTRIRQVFLNLLANASRFTNMGEVHVHASPRVDEIVIAVRDTGIGIAPDQLARLFDDFAQATQPGQANNEPPTQYGDGKGLGLAIAKRFVQMHGGRIWAESQLGKGSTFFVAIPMTTVQVAPAVRHSHIQTPQDSQQHLVVVDSDPAAATYLRRQLDGFRITPAADLDEARRLVLEQHPDAVLVNAPPDRGEAGREIGRATPAPILAEGVPLIQCTLPVGSWLLQGDYFDDWLVKPVESRKLLQMMERYCPPHGKILLADDDRSFVQLVQRILQAAGNPFTLEWAYTLEEGMAKLESAPPALVLVDIALAGSDGRRLAQWLRQHEAQVAHSLDEAGDLPHNGVVLTRAIPIVAISSFAPGADGDPLRSCSFGLTRKEGFSESELLELIVQSARQVRPRYAPWSSAEGMGEPLGLHAETLR